MLKSKELRAKAWNSLKGKYWSAFAVVLVLGALGSIGSGLVSYAQNLTNPTTGQGSIGTALVALVASIAGLLCSIFVGNAATVGQSRYFIKNTDSSPAFAEAFFGFKVQYRRNIVTLLVMGIKLALWCLLFVIPGIIKWFEYAMIPYILADDPEISSADAFRKAKEMMKGNKWRLFKLNFSFIGWELLCFLTLGLGVFFLLPYLNAANAEFYAELKNKQTA